MPALENAQEEAFCQHYATTSNAAESYRKATGRTQNADVQGSKWVVKGGIPSRIAEIRAENARKCELSKEEALKFLADVVRTAVGTISEDSPLCQEHSRTISDHSTTDRVKMPAKLDAIKQLAVMCGWNEPEKIEHSGSIAIPGLEDAARAVFAPKA